MESRDKASEMPTQASADQNPPHDLPVLPYPAPEHVSSLLPDEIAHAVQIYLYTTTALLRLPSVAFTTASDPTGSWIAQILEFLRRYVSQRALAFPAVSSPSLDEKVFALIFRFVSEGRDIAAWIDWPFVLGVVSGWYESRQDQVAALLGRLWRRARGRMGAEFEELRNKFCASLDLMIVDDENDIVPTLTALRYTCALSPDLLAVLTADDNKFLLVLYAHYNSYRGHFSLDERHVVLYLCYTILVCLAHAALEAGAGQSKKGKGTAEATERAFVGAVDGVFGEFARGGRMDSFVEDLDSETPFREVMEEWVAQWKGADEPVEGLAAVIEGLKIEDGKAVSQGETSLPAQDESEFQKTSLISQVVDILPHLGDGFIEACLTTHNWDMEKTISAILSNDLPPSLATMNQSAPRSSPYKLLSSLGLTNGRLCRTIRSQEAPPVYFTPEYTASDRRNVFDNDVFDLKQVSPAQIHRGHKDRTTATDLLKTSRKFMQSAKSRILATQWDEYEDEYVDTYDEPLQSLNTQRRRLKGIRDDVDEETTESEAEEDVERVVFAAYKRTPEIFERTARKTKEREALKAETRWSDEQIEGWKSIAERDPLVLKQLEERELEVIVQTDLPSTAWKAPRSGVGSEDEEGGMVGGVRGRGGASGRGTGSNHGGFVDARGGKGKGRGRGGRGRGVDRGRAKKDRIRAEYRPEAQ